MLDEFGPAQHKLVKCTNLCANFSCLILLSRGRPFLVLLDRYSRPYNCFAVIYHSSSYLGLLLSFEEYVLSAAVIVGRYLFLYIQAISEYLLANFNRLLCLGRYYFVTFSLITDFPVLTISELLLMIIKLLNLLLSFV